MSSLQLELERRDLKNRSTTVSESVRSESSFDIVASCEKLIDMSISVTFLKSGFRTRTASLIHPRACALSSELQVCSIQLSFVMGCNTRKTRQKKKK